MWLEVKQEVDTLLYNATDLLNAYNKAKWEQKRIDNYLANQSTKEYIELLLEKELEKAPSVNTLNSRYLEKELEKAPSVNLDKPQVGWVVVTRRGKFGGTWFNQHLLVDFMMWLSPEFKHEAINFILTGQSLALGRNKIKEGYKRMCHAIMDSWSSNYRDEATMLNVLVSGSPSSNQRARYWEDKLQLMDDMQKANATMIRVWMSLEDRKTALVKEFLS